MALPAGCVRCLTPKATVVCAQAVARTTGWPPGAAVVPPEVALASGMAETLAGMVKEATARVNACRAASTRRGEHCHRQPPAPRRPCALQSDVAEPMDGCSRLGWDAQLGRFCTRPRKTHLAHRRRARLAAGWLFWRCLIVASAAEPAAWAEGVMPQAA